MSFFKRDSKFSRYSRVRYAKTGMSVSVKNTAGSSKIAFTVPCSAGMAAPMLPEKFFCAAEIHCGNSCHVRSKNDRTAGASAS